MSLLITEALAVGAKEALKAAAALVLVKAVLRGPERAKGALWGLYAGFLASLVIAVSAFFTPFPEGLKPVIGKLSGYGFFVFFFVSVAAFQRGAGPRMLDFLKPAATKAMPFVSFIGAFLFFAPDFAGSAMFLGDLGVLRENPAGTCVSSGAGFLAVSLIGYFVSGRFLRMGRFLGAAEFLLMLALIKLLAGGAKGLAEFSLIPAVQRGVMKFVHDITHQTLVFFMVPDHPLLKVTVWNFIGILFGPSLALYIVLVMLLAPPVLMMKRNLIGPVPLPLDVNLRRAEKRVAMAAVRAERRRRSLPAILFCMAVLVFWFSGKAGEVSAIYNPKPLPVVEDKGQIVIPISTPALDLLDGMVHKFSASVGEDNAIFFVIKRPDGKLAVCMDDCEICPAKGYGQSGSHVVCLYCNTPIPLETLSEPGGCNPIPLKAEIGEKDLRVDFDYLQRKWFEEKSKQ